MTRRIAVRGIIVHENKLLCFKLKHPKTDKTADFWSTPGGGLDDGEALHDGLMREMTEETGITPVIDNLLFIQQFAKGDDEHLEFFFRIDNAADYLQLDLSKTTHGESEIAEHAFINPREHHLLPEFLQSQDFSALNAHTPTLVFNYLSKGAV